MWQTHIYDDVASRMQEQLPPCKKKVVSMSKTSSFHRYFESFMQTTSVNAFHIPSTCRRCCSVCMTFLSGILILDTHRKRPMASVSVSVNPILAIFRQHTIRGSMTGQAQMELQRLRQS